MRKPIVAAIAFDGIRPFHLSVPCLVFGEDRTTEGLPAIDFRVCAPEANTLLRTESGLGLMAPYDLGGLEGADLVIMPSWLNKEAPVPAALTAALRAAHAAGALVVGLCLGAFPLAAAGLLDGREATTHWLATDHLAQCYPAIIVRPDQLYVDTGDIITSAGVAASLDCCLHIVRRLYGADAAQRLARRIVLSPHRQGGQAQFIEAPVAAAPATDALAQALDRVLADLGRAHELDSVADLARMSRRTFTRKFHKRTGLSFARWLSAQRLLKAQELLETTGRSIDDIADLSGFGTATSMRQHFAAALHTSPARYRREFARGV
jgi:transcriptional regulator GlxA family with amidase domain